MKRFLRLILIVLFSSVALAQTAVVKRNVNLRPDASTDHKAIATLKPGTQVKLLEPDQTNGFFHVRAGGKKGWVWARNITVQESGVAPSTATPAGTSGCVSGIPAGTHVGPPELYPTPAKTPGCADTLKVSDLTKKYTENCPSGKTSCTYSQSHRSVSSNERQEVYDAYNVPPEHRNGHDGEVDHFYPLCAGGSNDPTNLWYQAADNEWNGKNFGFHEKDRLETFVCAQIKAHKMDPKDAFDRITKDWVKFYLDEGLDSDD